MDSIMSIRD